MGFPKHGLYYQDALNRLLRYKSVEVNPNMREALIDDVRIHEGEDGAREVETEFLRKRYGNDRVKMSKGSKAVTSKKLLDGKKMGAGRYIFDGEKTIVERF